MCIHRIPDNLSVIYGRSHCPACKKQIKWYDNIPLLSFIILKAQCRDCSAQINSKYFMIELITALSFVFIFYLFGITSTSLLFFILCIGFVIIFFIDLKHFIIPNEITFTMMIIGFLKSFDPNLHFLFPNYLDSLIGGLFGYGVIWSIIFFYKQIRKKEGMGLGDAKLLSAIGFWFGWISIPFVLFFSSVFALIWVTPDLIKKSKKLATQIPFGPYLILASILFFVSKEKLIDLLVI